MKRYVLVCALMASLLCFGALVSAQQAITEEEMAALQEAYEQLISQGDPVKERQTVYSITPWDGHQLGTGTIAVNSVDTIFAIADAPTLINSRRSDIYYWPITREYMADWFGVNEPVEGRLRIKQGRNEIALLELETYTDYYPDGSQGERLLLFGDEAVQAYDDYNAAMDEYIAAQQANFEEQLQFNLAVEKMLADVRETGEYIAEDEAPKSPRQPQQPTQFVFKPRTAFVLNLPAGNYTIEMVDADGNVIPDTVKKLQVFAPRRESLGYSVVPEHMWTRNFASNAPSDILYLEGRRIFYLKPFEALEFNQYQYYKSQNLENPLFGEGVKSSYLWRQTDEADPNLVLQILREGEVIQEIPRKPYYVRQTQGHALGYNILEYDQDDPIMANASPSFEAYRIELAAVRGGYTMRMVDADGNIVPGSTREIRAINNDVNWALYGVPLIPFLIGLVVWIRRLRLRPRAGKVPVEA